LERLAKRASLFFIVIICFAPEIPPKGILTATSLTNRGIGLKGAMTTSSQIKMERKK
jgi:hypothetical protein